MVKNDVINSLKKNIWTNNPGKILLKINCNSLIDKIIYNPFFICLLFALTINLLEYWLGNMGKFSIKYSLVGLFISFFVLSLFKTNKITLYENFFGIGFFSVEGKRFFYNYFSGVPIKYTNIVSFSIRNKTIILNLDKKISKNYFNKIDINHIFLVIYSIFRSSLKLKNLSIEESESIKNILLKQNINQV